MNPTRPQRSYDADRRGFSNEAFRDATVTQLGAAAFYQCTFHNVSFYRANLSHTTFERCAFVNCNLADATMPWTTIVNSSFTSSDFAGISLAGARIDRSVFEDCSLRGARIRTTNISDTHFIDTSFERATLSGTQIDKCLLVNVSIGNTVFTDSFLDDFCDSQTLNVVDRCTIDWKSICHSLRSDRLMSFLVRAGMPELFAEYSISSAHTIDPAMLFKLMRSTFISYGSPDVVFARRLRAGLQRNGVRTFFFENDAVPGEKLHVVMRDGVNRYDRIIVICSRNSLDRPAVLNEIEQAIARESRSGGLSCLIPIALDDYVFEWTPERAYLAQEIRDRVVADFRDTDADEARFSLTLGRLLAALKVS